MCNKAFQNQRLDYLVEAFKADSVQYKDLQTPTDTEGRRRILRSLMNIRMPGKMDDSVLAVQAIVNAANSQMLKTFFELQRGVIPLLLSDIKKAAYEETASISRGTSLSDPSCGFVPFHVLYAIKYSFNGIHNPA